MVTQKELKRLFSYDGVTGLFTRLVTVKVNAKKGSIAGVINGQRYSELCISGVKYQSHRMAWLYTYGSNPSGQIDHINRNRSDNRIINLRDVTSQQNSRNRTPSINKFGVIGLSWCRKSNKFYSRITVDRKTKYLGCYASMLDAICARKSAENKYGFR